MKRAVIILMAFLFLVSFSYGRSCLIDGDCDDDRICTSDYCDCSDDDDNTTCNLVCFNDAIDDCDEERYVRSGNTFNAGTGACEDVFNFEYADNDTMEVRISGKDYSYDNASKNEKGYKIVLPGRHNITFIVRYNPSTERLFLESVSPSCPVTDECQNYLDCVDDDECTIDDCTGSPQRCKNKPILYCRDEDGCCPEKCSWQDDSDCKECDTDDECDDSDDGTTEYCTEDKKCVYEEITECIEGDGFCPAGCTIDEDTDCPEVLICGDGECTGTETSDTCCADCPCPGDLECIESRCRTTEEKIALDIVNKNSEVNKAKRDLVEQGYRINSTDMEKSEGAWLFSVQLENEGKYAYIRGAIEGNNVTSLNVVGIGSGSNILLFFGIILMGVIIVLVVVTRIIPRKPEEDLSDEIFISENDKGYDSGESHFK